MIILWEYIALSKKEIEEKIEEYLYSEPKPENIQQENLIESFHIAYNLTHKALKNKIPGCRAIPIKGWRIVALNEYISGIITLSYFNSETIGFEELNEKQFIKKLTKISPTSIPMFIGIENTLDKEIENTLERLYEKT